MFMDGSRIFDVVFMGRRSERQGETMFKKATGASVLTVSENAMSDVRLPQDTGGISVCVKTAGRFDPVGSGDA